MSYYAVAIGRTQGIYKTWNECKYNVDKYPGAVYKKFKTQNEAIEFIRYNINPEFNVSTTNIQKTNIIPITNTNLISNSISKTNITSIQNINNNRIIIWTDGACKNNGQNKEVGGAGVFFGDNDSRNISQKLTGYVTNNRAEMMAVIYALQISTNNKYLKIEIKTDSMYIVNGMTKSMNNWKSRNYLNVKNSDLWKQLDYYSNLVDIKWTHVSAHCGIHGNEMADSLANQCL